MSDTRVLSASFPTLDAARTMRRRLARAGFARNSIDIARRDEGDEEAFEVAIRTRDENRARAERILSGRSVTDALERTRAGARDFVHANPAAALGLAAVAGFIVFGLTRRH